MANFRWQVGDCGCDCGCSASDSCLIGYGLGKEEAEDLAARWLDAYPTKNVYAQYLSERGPASPGPVSFQAPLPSASNAGYYTIKYTNFPSSGLLTRTVGFTTKLLSNPPELPSVPDGSTSPPTIKTSLFGLSLCEGRLSSTFTSGSRQLPVFTKTLSYPNDISLSNLNFNITTTPTGNATASTTDSWNTATVAISGYISATAVANLELPAPYPWSSDYGATIIEGFSVPYLSTSGTTVGQSIANETFSTFRCSFRTTNTIETIEQNTLGSIYFCQIFAVTASSANESTPKKYSRLDITVLGTANSQYGLNTSTTYGYSVPYQQSVASGSYFFNNSVLVNSVQTSLSRLPSILFSGSLSEVSQSEYQQNSTSDNSVTYYSTTEIAVADLRKRCFDKLAASIDKKLFDADVDLSTVEATVNINIPVVYVFKPQGTPECQNL